MNHRWNEMYNQKVWLNKQNQATNAIMSCIAGTVMMWVTSFWESTQHVEDSHCKDQISLIKQNLVRASCNPGQAISYMRDNMTGERYVVCRCKNNGDLNIYEVPVSVPNGIFAPKAIEAPQIDNSRDITL